MGNSRSKIEHDYPEAQEKGIKAGGIVTGNDTASLAAQLSNAEKRTERLAPEFAGVRG